MRGAVFADTGLGIARLSPLDQLHAKARELKPGAEHRAGSHHRAGIGRNSERLLRERPVCARLGGADGAAALRSVRARSFRFK